MIAGLIGIIALFILLGIIIIILAIIFWIRMLINAIKRKYKDKIDKIVWVLVIIFLGLIGALIYYFVVKRK
jgi:hypothetical protein